MKKFTFLLSLLLAFVGVTASAQTSRSWKKLSADADVAKAVTDLNALTDGGTYAFYSVGQSKYITIDNFDNLHFGRAASLTATDAESGLAVFKFHITTTGGNTTYTFETAIEGQYMPAAADNNGKGGATATGTAASFVIQKTTINEKTPVTNEGQFVIVNKEATNGKYYAFDMGGDDTNQFCGWEGKGSNCWYKIVPVTVSEETASAYKVAHIAKKDGVALETYNEWVKDGATTSAHTFMTPYYYEVSNNVKNWVVSAGNNQFEYTFNKTEEDAPVEFSTDNNKVWYTLKTRNNDGNYLVRQADNIIRSGSNSHVSKYDATCITSLDLLDGGLWAFVEDGVAVKLLNKQNGKYLRVNGANNQANFNGAASKFYFQKITPDGGFAADFSLQYAATSFLGDHSTTPDGTPLLATYNNAGAYKDNGSAFIAKKIDLNSDAQFLSLAKSAVTAEIDAATANNASSENLVTQTADALSTGKTKVTSATSYDAVVAAHATAFYYPANVDANAYYQIVAQSVVNNTGENKGKAYISSESMVVNKDGALEAGADDSRIIRRTNASGALVPQLWQLVANTDGSYKIKNANTNCYIGQIVQDAKAVEMPIATDGVGDYVITKGQAANKFLLKNGSNLLNAYGGDANTIIANYNDANDNGSNWVIKKVTTVPVSITDAKYATVAFPFATKVATDGVKAYYATGAADGMITLVEYPEGIIPANQGALLYNAKGATTANLTIEATSNTVENNILMPTTAKRSGFTANDTYVLAKNAEGEAAFLKNGLTVVPANKAYVATGNIPAGSSSNVLNFNFGQTTGINGVVAADKAGVQYFDLQGRRVLYPAHGIFVTNTGKKVFVK